jgi:hypothetical protein
MRWLSLKDWLCYRNFGTIIYLFRPKLLFSKSMKMALKDTKLSDVDAIVMHAPEP